MGACTPNHQKLIDYGCRKMSRSNTATISVESKAIPQSDKTANVKDDLSIQPEWILDDSSASLNLSTPSADSINRSDNQSDSYSPWSTSLSAAADVEPTPCKMVTLKDGHEKTDPSRGHIVYHDSIGRSSATASEYQLVQDYPRDCSLSAQNSPDLQLNEFLNLPEANDVSASSMSPAGSGPYVPMQARPILSYAEHQRAIYSRRHPVDFNMDEMSSSDVSWEDNVKWVSGDYVSAEELYDMSLKALHEDSSS